MLMSSCCNCDWICTFAAIVENGLLTSEPSEGVVVLDAPNASVTVCDPSVDTPNASVSDAALVELVLDELELELLALAAGFAW
jgi:proline racemase